MTTIPAKLPSTKPPLSAPLAARPPGAARMFVLLLQREALAERRTLGWLSSGGFLALQMIVILGLGFAGEIQGETRTALGAGALWLAFLFAGATGVGRAFAQEQEGGALAGLLLLPMDRGVLYLAKVTAGTVFMLVALAVLLGGAAIFMHLPVGPALAKLAPLMALGALGYVAAACMIAPMTAGLRGRDALLALLLFPIVVPLFVAAVSGARDALLGAGWEALRDEMIMLAAFDALYLGLGMALFQKVVEG